MNKIEMIKEIITAVIGFSLLSVFAVIFLCL